MGILTPGSIKIERGMKKYFRGLILRIFGLMGSSLVPGEGSGQDLEKDRLEKVGSSSSDEECPGIP